MLETPVAVETRTARRPGRRLGLVALVLAALALLGIAYELGLRSPWSAHHGRWVDGTAWRNGGDDTAMFEGEDGTHVWFELDGVVWKSGEQTGSSRVPPCLREPASTATVEAEVIEVGRPYGSGSYEQVLAVTCLG